MAKKSSGAPKAKKASAKRKSKKPVRNTTRSTGVADDVDAQEPPALAPRERGLRRFSDEQIADALRNTGGVYSDAARWLQGVYKRRSSRASVSRYVQESPYLQAAVRHVNAGAIVQRLAGVKVQQ